MIISEKVTVSRVFDGALALIDEVNDGSVPDYVERCPYIVAAFCAEVGAIDVLLRKSSGTSLQRNYSAVSIGMNEEFPLLPRFLPAATAYLAAMLVLEENEELYERLYERYSDLMAGICSEIPGASEKIVDSYGGY